MPDIQHIVLITAFYPPDRHAGAELGTRFIARAACQRGHRVTVIVTRPDPENRDRHETRDGAIEMVWLSTINLPFLRFFGELLFASLAIRRLKPDRIHGQCLLPAAFLAGFWGRRLKIPSTAYLYGNDVSQVSTFMRLTFARAALSRCEQIFAASAWCADLAEALPPYRTAIIRYSGFDDRHFSPDTIDGESIADVSASDHILLFVGRLIDDKAVDVLIDAVAILASDHASLKLVIVGRGPLQAALQKQADDAGVSNRILWVEHVPNAELACYFRRADVFVLPSRREPFGVVNLEAMACGCAVVFTGVMGTAEAVVPDRDGIAVPADDPAALAEAVNGLLKDPDRRRELGRNAVDRAKAFAWQPLLEEWMATFEQ